MKYNLPGWRNIFIIPFSFFIFILHPIHSYGQGNTSEVKGIVQDKNNKPLHGVSVIIKNSKTNFTSGTNTDTSGMFIFPRVAPGGPYSFTFSSVGYESETLSGYNIKGGISLSLALNMTPNTASLDQVVVVGYGTQRKGDLTGSVATANLDAFRQSPNVNILQSLQGSVPGVTIGQTNEAGEEASINIRGISTLNGNTSPLIVVDNIIFSGRISDINPVDVESVQILKDASSKAIYGSQAANGVILITTKSGKTGRNPTFTYSGSHAVSTPTIKARMLNREAFLQKARDIEWRNAYTAASNYTEPNPAFTYLNTDFNTPLDLGISNGTDFDWYNEVKRPAHISSHTIGASGGSEKIAYYMSAGYTDQKGFIKNDNYKRLTIRMNLDTRFTDWLKIGANISGSFTDFSGDQPNLVNLTRTSPLVKPWDENGDLIVNPLADISVNPLLTATNDNYETRNRFIGNFYGIVNLPWIKGLTYRINQGSNVLFNKDFGSSIYGAGRTGSAYKNNSFQLETTLDNILNYTRQIGDHNINATAVYGYNKARFERTAASGTGFTDLILSYNNLALAEVRTVDSEAWEESSLYQMGRLSYNYKDKYLITATVRNDGFSGFSANNKTAIFPSVGIGWVISEENFFKVPLLNYLKLRGSYGENGNKAARYSSLAVVGAEPSSQYVYGAGGATTIGRSARTLANNNLRWEKTAGINLGLDFGLFENKLKGNIEYYNSDTKDLLWSMIIPQASGFSSVLSNIGNIKNKGFEIFLEATPVKTKRFSWTIGVNLSHNNNKILSLLGDDNDGDGKEDDLVASGLFIGQSIGTIYDYQVEGIWQVNEKAPTGFEPGSYKLTDQNGDGNFTAAADRVIIGHTEPAYQFGIQNTITYQQFALRFFINSIQGGKNGYMAANQAIGGIDTKGNASNSNWFDFYDYWAPTRPNAVYSNPWVGSPLRNSRKFFQRNFVRLQDISLSYDLPKSTVAKWGIKGLKVFVSGKNVVTLTKWDGWDPETGQGIESDDPYPLMKSFSIGLDLSF